jgi:outer membrane protein OmpA-like peptidoglycan-associated protein
MASHLRRHWQAAAAALLICCFAGLLAFRAEPADVKPPPAGDAKVEAGGDRSDPAREQVAPEAGKGDAAATAQADEVRALRARVEAAESQIQLLKSVVVQALRAQSAAEATLRREREARDVAPAAGPGATGSDEPMLAAQLEALTQGLDRLREDVAALRTEVLSGREPAAGSAPVPEEAEPAAGAAADPLAESGVGGEYDPLIQGERVASVADDAADLGDQMEVGWVHFDSGSADLTPGGQREALEAAERIRAMEAAKVRVVGHADTVGGAGFNRQLSVRRARAIAGLLERVGLSGDLVEIVGRGEDGAPVPTADQVSEPLNRCAGIFVVMDSPK